MNRLPTILSGLQQIHSKCFKSNSMKSRAVNGSFNRFREFCCVSDVSSRGIHLTGVKMDILWRRNRRLPKNPTSSGPLTDLPDYTYMDGRPTPLGVMREFLFSISFCSYFLPETYYLTNTKL